MCSHAYEKKGKNTTLYIGTIARNSFNSLTHPPMARCSLEIGRCAGLRAGPRSSPTILTRSPAVPTAWSWLPRTWAMATCITADAGTAMNRSAVSMAAPGAT